MLWLLRLLLDRHDLRGCQLTTTLLRRELLGRKPATATGLLCLLRLLLERHDLRGCLLTTTLLRRELLGRKPATVVSLLRLLLLDRGCRTLS